MQKHRCLKAQLACTACTREEEEKTYKNNWIKNFQECFNGNSKIFFLDSLNRCYLFGTFTS